MQVLFSFDGHMSYVLDHKVTGGENQACNRPLLFMVDMLIAGSLRLPFFLGKSYPLLQEPCCCFQCVSSLTKKSQFSLGQTAAW